MCKPYKRTKNLTLAQESDEVHVPKTHVNHGKLKTCKR
jgi:hypothetical protein